MQDSIPKRWVFIAWDDNQSVNLDFAVYDTGLRRRVVAHLPDSFSVLESRENGRLIAEAPEMLEILKAIPRDHIGIGSALHFQIANLIARIEEGNE